MNTSNEAEYEGGTTNDFPDLHYQRIAASPEVPVRPESKSTSFQMTIGPGQDVRIVLFRIADWLLAVLVKVW